MIKECKEVLNQLGRNQYYSFLKYAIGLKAFCERDESQFITDRIDNKNKKYFKTIGILVNKKMQTLFYVEKEDADLKIFRAKNEETPYSTYDYFDDVNQFIILAILISVSGFKKINQGRAELIETFNSKGFFEKFRPAELQFILGAGVNMDSNLHTNIGDWNKLIDDIRTAVRKIKGIMPTPINPPIAHSKYTLKMKACDSLIDMEESLCNTNYIGPEILKRLDEDEYYKAIYNNLYSSFDARYLDASNNSDLIGTNAYQIARIMETQGKGRVLTFNYDDVLENVFSKNFHGEWQSVYYGKDFDFNKSIFFIHSHGYFPYAEEKRKPQGIVLSTYEYLEGYYSHTSYARKRLSEQLACTNILVGNSVSDYEEQKVFYTQMKKKASSWHFLFTKSSDPSNRWMDVFKTCYFINMGIIPVYFNDYSDITDFLKTLK